MGGNALQGLLMVVVDAGVQREEHTVAGLQRVQEAHSPLQVLIDALNDPFSAQAEGAHGFRR
ncbi:MAG: hypothetical protein RLZZ516_1979 [Cyanobacteriota bacterium]